MGTNSFTLSFVTIGNPGNSNDVTGYGKVSYGYKMGTYDISQNQINIAKSNGLAGMPLGSWLGDQPATSINWFQAAAFVNWLNTNQGYSPAYNITYSGGLNGFYSMSLWPSNQAWTLGGTNLYRNANCCYFLPSENEWYKAAYYDSNKNNGLGGYWQYSDGMNSLPVAVASGTAAGTAVYFNGAYLFSPATVTQSGGLSPYGTMGQGGNVNQWIEGASSGSNTDTSLNRVVRGGCWGFGSNALLSSYRNNNGDYGNGYPATQNNSLGFRVARILP